MAKKERVTVEGDTVKITADPRDILNTEGLLLSLCMGSQALGKIADHEIAKLRDDLDYENSSGCERVLIDHIVLCWMRHRKWEFGRAGLDVSGSPMKADIEFVERQLHMSHTRYLRSIEELVKVRFLMSRTNMHRLQAVQDSMKRKDEPQQEPGKLLELKAG